MFGGSAARNGGGSVPKIDLVGIAGSARAMGRHLESAVIDRRVALARGNREPYPGPLQLGAADQDKAAGKYKEEQKC